MSRDPGWSLNNTSNCIAGQIQVNPKLNIGGLHPNRLRQLCRIGSKNEKIIHYADIGAALIKARDQHLNPFKTLKAVMPRLRKLKNQQNL